MAAYTGVTIGDDVSISTTNVDLTNVDFVNLPTQVFIDTKDPGDLPYPLVGLSNDENLSKANARVVRSFAETFPREHSMQRTASYTHDFAADFTPGADPCSTNSPATVTVEFTGRASEEAKISTLTGNSLTVNPAGLHPGDTAYL